MGRGKFALWLLFLQLSWCALAHAQQGSAAAASKHGPYADVIGEAVREFGAGNFIEARTLFEQAHEMKPSARTLRALGLCAYELKHYVQAVGELSAALSDAREPLTSAQRSDIEIMLAKARRYVGTLVLEVEPEEAAVQIDGEPTEARQIDLDVGDHVIGASAHGYRAGEQRITIRGEQTARAHVELVQLELSPPRVVAAATTEPAAEPRTAPAQNDRDQPGILSRWWFWTAAGVLVAGAVVGGVLVFGGGSETAKAEGGSTGVRLQPP